MATAVAVRTASVAATAAVGTATVRSAVRRHARTTGTHRAAVAAAGMATRGTRRTATEEAGRIRRRTRRLPAA